MNSDEREIMYLRGRVDALQDLLFAIHEVLFFDNMDEEKRNSAISMLLEIADTTMNPNNIVHGQVLSSSQLYDYNRGIREGFRKWAKLIEDHK